MSIEENNIMLVLETEIKKQARDHYDEIIKHQVINVVKESLFNYELWPNGLPNTKEYLTTALYKCFSDCENKILPAIEKYYRNQMLLKIKKIQ